MTSQQVQSEVYEGQFGAFTITEDDRREVVIFRAGLMAAALCFAAGSALVLLQGAAPWAVRVLTPLFACFWLSMGGEFTDYPHLFKASPPDAAVFLGHWRDCGIGDRGLGTRPLSDDSLSAAF